MLEVKFEVEGLGDWVDSITSEDARLSIVEVKANRKSVSDLIEVSSEKINPEELVRHLREAKDVRVNEFERVNRNTMIGTISSQSCPVCSVFSGLDCFLISAWSNGEKKMQWRLFARNGEQLKKLYRRLDSNGVKYTILSVTRKFRMKEITSRQEEILRIALDLGYFESPRRINLRSLSGRLGIAPGTLSEIIRRAQKNILTNYFTYKKS
ncbi:MAG: helix-turn-helix domain-containing protein [Conexivisphaerales archaeon]